MTSHVSLVFADRPQDVRVGSYLWVVNLWQKIIVRKMSAMEVLVSFKIKYNYFFLLLFFHLADLTSNYSALQ